MAQCHETNQGCTENTVTDKLTGTSNYRHEDSGPFGARKAIDVGLSSIFT